MDIPHVFSAPFYFIDYALALICALQFWRKSRMNFADTWEDYIRLCKVGGSVSFSEALKIGGLKSPFDSTTIDEVVDHLEAVLQEMEEEFVVQN